MSPQTRAWRAGSSVPIDVPGMSDTSTCGSKGCVFVCASTCAYVCVCVCVRHMRHMRRGPWQWRDRLKGTRRRHLKRSSTRKAPHRASHHGGQGGGLRCLQGPPAIAPGGGGPPLRPSPCCCSLRDGAHSGACPGVAALAATALAAAATAVAAAAAAAAVAAAAAAAAAIQHAGLVGDAQRCYGACLAPQELGAWAGTRRGPG